MCHLSLDFVNSDYVFSEEGIYLGFFFQDVKDDYIFECEAGNQYQKTKLTILQSLGDPLYYGKIQPCKEDEESDSPMSPSQ